MKHDTKLYPLFLILLLLTFTFTGNSYSQTWNALGSGTNGVIYASAIFNGELVVAGKFSSPAGNIARWNGTTWSPLGTGTNDTVFALTIYNNQLVAAGSFLTAGGVTCNRIARWNGTTWTSFGLGANNTVLSVLFAGTYLRAGGRFTAVGGVNCSKIARFDGTNWSAMGAGVNNDVHCMVVFGSDLVLGGIFTMAGSVTANRIVRFNISSGAYTAVGTGVDNNTVMALGTFNNNLYVGGNFTAIGGITINNIARWSGTNWNIVSTGTSGPVKSMFTNGNTSILIGGSFITAGGLTVNNIANFNGSIFSTLGAGISGGGTPSVNTIAYWLNVLIAAGSFTTAGTSPIPAANVAGYGLLPIAPTLISPPDGATGQSVTPLLTWTLVSGASTYGVNVARDANFTIMVINVAGLVSPQYQVPGGTILLNNTTYFWRANARNGLGTGPWSLVRFFTTAMVGIINNHEIPLAFNLYQNYPNPFNPVTKIRFDLPDVENVSALKLTVYDIKGEKVSDILNTEYTPGKWEMDFDASNLASGIYFYTIEAGPYVQTNKMILIK